MISVSADSGAQLASKSYKVRSSTAKSELALSSRLTRRGEQRFARLDRSVRSRRGACDHRCPRVFALF